MPREFRYSLTRVCLRRGQLSLSQGMAEIFPDSGSFTAVDMLDDRELQLDMAAPRRVTGLAEYMHRHELEVNDSVTLRPLPDGRVALTAVRRRSPSDHRDPRALADLLHGLLREKPCTEAEIRALYSDLPARFPLTETLRDDGRFHFQGGRWTAQRRPEAAGAGPAIPERAAEQEEWASDRRPKAESFRFDRSRPEWGAAGSEAGEPPRQRLERKRPSASRAPGEEVRRAAVTPYPRGVMFPGEAALNSKRPEVDLTSINRARTALVGFGYRVEGLPYGMLRAKAELGRKQHSVLVRVLGEGERLDWAALLARRREHGADHLAIFGDHRDLHRLGAPAELARATLWSWDGVARVQSLAETVMVGPFDLEPHFEKDGMFGPGLERFENDIGRLVSERGTLSAVLSRLATRRAPSVFVLDDLVDEELSRDQAAQALELLGQAPFHLVARVDQGEYCLRHGVADGLLRLSEYALSLRDRLPGTHGERITATSLVEGDSASESSVEEAVDDARVSAAEDARR